MKYLKTNEEFIGALGKALTGHRSEKDFDAAKDKFEKDLSEMEAKAGQNNVKFDKETIMKSAADRNYIGKLRVLKNRVVFDDGKTIDTTGMV